MFDYKFIQNIKKLVLSYFILIIPFFIITFLLLIYLYTNIQAGLPKTIVFILIILRIVYLFLSFLLFSPIIRIKKLSRHIKTNSIIFRYNPLNTLLDNYIEKERYYNKLIVDLNSANDKLDRNNKINSAIMEITNEILKSADIDALLQSILDKAISIFPNAQKGSILLLEDGILEFKVCMGYDINTLKKIKLNLEDTFQYQSGSIYEPCIVKNIEKFNYDHLDNDEYILLKNDQALEAKSVLSCSIIIDNTIYGTINLDNLDNVDAFNIKDKSLIKHLATQIAIAIRNTHLLKKTIQMSKYDSLTGIYNRYCFEESIKNYYTYALRYNTIFTLCIFDLNNLKYINDNFGHFAGDTMITYFSDTTSKSIRKTDIFGRTGGDEFTLLFINSNKEQVYDIVEKLCLTFKNNPLCINDCDYILTFGYGLAEYPLDAKDLNSLTKIADKHMYENKIEVKKKIIKGQPV